MEAYTLILIRSLIYTILIWNIKPKAQNLVILSVLTLIDIPALMPVVLVKVVISLGK